MSYLFKGRRAKKFFSDKEKNWSSICLFICTEEEIWGQKQVKGKAVIEMLIDHWINLLFYDFLKKCWTKSGAVSSVSLEIVYWLGKYPLFARMLA